MKTALMIFAVVLVVIVGAALVSAAPTPELQSPACPATLTSGHSFLRYLITPLSFEQGCVYTAAPRKVATACVSATLNGWVLVRKYKLSNGENVCSYTPSSEPLE